MQNLSVTIIQSDLVWEDASSNLKNFDKKLSGLKPVPDLVILPEMFNTGFSVNPENCAEKYDGLTLNWMQEKAGELNCVLTGSVLIDENGKFFNRFIWMQPDGSFLHYDKRHLFRLVGEDKIITAGNERLVVELKNWKILPLICYDLRFPVWSKNNYINGSYEYDLVLYIANWPEIRRYAWKKLLIARAIENQAYCIGVNRVGKDGNGITHSGDSRIIDPAGQLVGEIESYKEDVLNAFLYRDKLEDMRNKFNFGLDWDEFEIVNN